MGDRVNELLDGEHVDLIELGGAVTLAQTLQCLPVAVLASLGCCRVMRLSSRFRTFCAVGLTQWHLRESSGGFPRNESLYGCARH